MQNLKPKTTITSQGKKQKKVAVRYQQLNQGGRKLTESSAARMALMHSKYLNSVLDPFNEPGAKIPDEITVPSFTAQTITKIVLPAQTGTGTFAGYGCGLVKIMGAVQSTYNGCVNTILPSSSLSTYITAAYAGAWSGGAQIVSIANVARPVSAALAVQVLGSMNNNQGRIIIGFLPPNDANTNISTVGTNVLVSTLAACTYTADIPAAKVVGRTIWLPLDSLARSYTAVGGDTRTAARGQASSGNMLQYGQLFCLVDGLQSGVNVEFQIAENWEIVPQSNQLNIVQASVSHSDPLELAAASNFIAANPTISQHQPQSLQLTGTPQSGMIRTENKGPGFLDRVLSGLEGGLKVAKRVAPIAAEMLAML